MTAASPTDFPGRWLVTGGCGFIGSVLIRALRERGVSEVRILDDLSRGSPDAVPAPGRRVVSWPDAPESWEPGVDIVVGGVENYDAVSAVVQGADVVVHLAANAGVVQSMDDPLRDLEVNVRGSLCVFEAARRAGVPRVVTASSAAAVGSAEPPVSERSLPRPSTPYGAGKLAGEAYAGAYAQAFGLETVALRFGNVYGPFSQAKDSVVARFIKQWRQGEPWVIYGDGDQTRDFIFIHDLVDAIIRAGTLPGVGGHVFQIATSRETSVNELAAALGDVLREMGLEPPRVKHGPKRPGDVRRNFSDTRLADELLGWRAQVTLPEGLRRTVEWFSARSAPSEIGA